MKYPNINLSARPDGMSVAQAAEVLRDQREEVEATIERLERGEDARGNLGGL